MQSIFSLRLIFVLREFRYTCTILLQFSLIFKERKSTSQNLLEKHAQLCHDVLMIMAQVAAKAKSLKLDDACWDVLLRVVVGVCHELLQKKASTSSLGSLLEKQLFRVLLDIWLRSKTSDKQHWEIFKKLSKKWIHRSWLKHWKIALRALSLHLFRILCGNSTTGENLQIQWSNTSGSTTAVAMTDKVLLLSFFPDMLSPSNVFLQVAIFSWYQMLHLIGQPSDFEDAKSMDVAIGLIAEIATNFLFLA